MGEKARALAPDTCRLAARILVAAGAIFWIWFGVRLATEQNATGWHLLFHLTIPGLALAFLFLVSWWWEMLAGVLLLLLSLSVAVYYPLFVSGKPPDNLAYTTLLLTLPPLAAGFLFLYSWGTHPHAAAQ